MYAIRSYYAASLAIALAGAMLMLWNPDIGAPWPQSSGQTLLETPEGPLPIEVFGKHNLNNLVGAKWICQHMGVDEDDFYEAIASFKGASRITSYNVCYTKLLRLF